MSFPCHAFKGVILVLINKSLLTEDAEIKLLNKQQFFLPKELSHPVLLKKKTRVLVVLGSALS